MSQENPYRGRGYILTVTMSKPDGKTCGGALRFDFPDGDKRVRKNVAKLVAIKASKFVVDLITEKEVAS